MKNKPLAAISLDLDNQWSYMKTHGDKEWISLPSYYSVFVPYAIEILRELDIKITFFIVGQDAVIDENRPYLKKICDEGHDLGNHSFNHEVWINNYSKEELISEIIRCEDAIFTAAGCRTQGFRGPGFSWSPALLEVLHERNYLYDASTLPTFIGPLARMYYFRKSDFSKSEKRKRKGLFGSFSEGFRRLKPYLFDLGQGRKLLEIPVTTMPLFRIPFHMSYLIYLGLFSRFLMKAYLNLAIGLCKITSTPVSFLLHPLDIIGGDKISALKFFPGMSTDSNTKIGIFKEVMGILKRHYRLVDMRTFALAIREKLNT